MNCLNDLENNQYWFKSKIKIFNDLFTRCSTDKILIKVKKKKKKKVMENVIYGYFVI